MTQDNNPNTGDSATGVCNFLGGIVTYNDPEMTFTISELGQTLILCGFPENEFFEINYFGLFYNSINTPLTYDINTSGDVNTLTITAPNGDTANYEELILSVQENELK